jgi:nucleotide-binding universal stress UspA family protein
MRILLAVDGSDCSNRAVQLVSTFQLPPESSIRVVAVYRPYTDALSLSWASMGGDASTNGETEEETETRLLREAVALAEADLQRPGVRVEGFLLRGRPATAIVEEAKAAGSDLVVVGSRGHGRIATMLLGSTASEVVDHAPCPVLVSRRGRLDPLVFADDGSPSARHAERVLTGWPLFADLPVTVVTVAEVAVPVAAGFTPGLYDQVLESYSRSADEAREEVRAEADSEAGRLAEAGHPATPVPLEGDPATEIVRYARDHQVATIVMGTRGHTGLARLILGSTARNVLLHADCSVLVVREHARP